MSYEINIDVAGYDTQPQEFATCLAPELLFSQIFNGLPQLYAGSSFTVEEIIEFYVTPLQREVIDVDLLWYPPKYYLGTWSLFSQLSGFGTNPENRGFLEDFITQVTRYSTYIIQANADVPIAVHEQAAIDDCNFFLGNVGLVIPPFDVAVQPLIQKEAVLKSRHTLQRVPLRDQPFNRKIKYFGIATRPGCICTGANYKARIINAISVDLPPFPLTVCSVADAPDCAAEFVTFLSTINQSQGFEVVWATQQAGIDSTTARGLVYNVDFSIIQSFHVCPQNPSVSTEYWILNLLNGP